MTPRSIRRAAERKAQKEMQRKALKEMQRKALKELQPKAQNEQQAGREDERPGITAAPRPSENTLPSRAVSEAQLAANRANAQLSTGPTSSDGKAKASLNAVKSALTGRTILLPSDDTAAYERHLQSFVADHSPLGPRESDLVQSLADTWWRLQRIPALEAALYAKGYLEFAGSFDEHEPSLRLSLISAETFLKYEKQFRNLQLQETRLYRRYGKDLAELRELQQARQGEEQAAPPAEAARDQVTLEAEQPGTSVTNGFEFSRAQIKIDMATFEPLDDTQPLPHESAQAA